MKNETDLFLVLLRKVVLNSFLNPYGIYYGSELVNELFVRKPIEVKVLLSRDCDGCTLQLFECTNRYKKAARGDKVYCPDGTVHLIDS